MNPSSETRGAAIALIGGLLGAMIGGGASFAAAQLSSSTAQQQFRFTQERNAYVNMVTTGLNFRTALIEMNRAANNKDKATFTAARAQAGDTFVKFSQAYHEAYLVSDDPELVQELYDSTEGATLNTAFEQYNSEAGYDVVRAFDGELSEFLHVARRDVREGLR